MSRPECFCTERGLWTARAGAPPGPGFRRGRFPPRASSKRSPPVTGAASASRTATSSPRPYSVPGALADQRLAALVVAEIFAPRRADRHQAVGAGLVQLHEQPEARDAGDAARSSAPMRSARKAASSGRWCRARPPWRGARSSEMCSAISPRRAISSVGSPSSPSLSAADQRAVHDQVGIAADRRGEMRVAAQSRPKWPELSGA